MRYSKQPSPRGSVGRGYRRRMLIRLVRESDVPSLHEHRLCGVTFEETAELVKTATDAEDGEETRFLVAVDEERRDALVAL